MKRIKIAFLSAALLLVTVAVFAERKDIVPANLYVDTGGFGNPVDMVQIDNATVFLGLTTTPSGNQAKIVSSAIGSPQYNLYTNDGGVFEEIYSVGF